MAVYRQHLEHYHRTGRLMDANAPAGRPEQVMPPPQVQRDHQGQQSAPPADIPRALVAVHNNGDSQGGRAEAAAPAHDMVSSQNVRIAQQDDDQRMLAHRTRNTSYLVRAIYGPETSDDENDDEDNSGDTVLLSSGGVSRAKSDVRSAAVGSNSTTVQLTPCLAAQPCIEDTEFNSAKVQANADAADDAVPALPEAVVFTTPASYKDVHAAAAAIIAVRAMPEVVAPTTPQSCATAQPRPTHSLGQAKEVQSAVNGPGLAELHFSNYAGSLGHTEVVLPATYGPSRAVPQPNSTNSSSHATNSSSHATNSSSHATHSSSHATNSSSHATNSNARATTTNARATIPNIPAITPAQVLQRALIIELVALRKENEDLTSWILESNGRSRGSA